MPGVGPGSKGNGVYSVLLPEEQLFWSERIKSNLFHTDRNKVFQHHVKRNGKSKYETCLVTPFAGKTKCFDKYIEGIKKLPLKDITVVIYDNSNSENFRKKLYKYLFPLFKDYKYIIDENRNFTVENTDEYFLIDKRTWEIYSMIINFIPKTNYIFIVEDDIEIPNGIYNRFLKLMELYPKIGTISGNIYNRRMNDPYYNWPIDWNITETKHIPSGKIEVECIQNKDIPFFGLQSVGSTSTGCWFTRYDLIKKLGIKYGVQGIRACDQSWGYRLNKAGYYIVVDRSARCKHYSNKGVV